MHKVLGSFGGVAVLLDEMWAFVGKKQKNCDPANPDDDHNGDWWDHVAFPEHKLVLAIETLPMRVSFDVDDTLVCGPSVPTERVVPRWRRWWYREELRRGTRELMGALLSRRCQIWVYTTSYRSPRYLRGWFKSFGVPLYGVVNQSSHDQVVGRQGPSKYPPAFGIDLHVDDSEGVRMEGERHGFAVVVVAPHDLDWTSRVLAAVDLRMKSTGRSGS